MMDNRDIAKAIMFGRADVADLIIRGGLKYKKGKDAFSLQKALNLACKKGRQKTELEIDLFEIYLGNIFKKTRLKDKS